MAGAAVSELGSARGEEKVWPCDTYSMQGIQFVAPPLLTSHQNMAWFNPGNRVIPDGGLPNCLVLTLEFAGVILLWWVDA